MTRRILLSSLALAAGILAVFLLSPALSLAQCNSSSIKNSIQCGTNGGAGVPVSTNPSNDIQGTITNVINLLSAAVGIAAVVMIIVGGFKYVTSASDSNKISSAKTTLLYALIGLIIVALAQVIVSFVLHTATAPPSSTPAASSSPPASSGSSSSGSLNCANPSNKGIGGCPP